MDVENLFNENVNDDNHGKDFDKLSGGIVLIQEHIIKIVLMLNSMKKEQSDIKNNADAEFAQILKSQNKIINDIKSILEELDNLKNRLDSVPVNTSRYVTSDILKEASAIHECKDEIARLIDADRDVLAKIENFPKEISNAAAKHKDMLQHSLVDYNDAIKSSADKYGRLGSALGYYAWIICCVCLAFYYWVTEMKDAGMIFRIIYAVVWGWGTVYFGFLGDKYYR